jgi:hypothetical protein
VSKNGRIVSMRSLAALAAVALAALLPAGAQASHHFNGSFIGSVARP